MNDVVMDDEGFILDDAGNPYGHCAECGAETLSYWECCEGAPILPERPLELDA